MGPVKIVDAKGAGLTVYEWDNVYFPNWPWLKDAHLKALRTMPLREDDVFLCTYPKSGTHWAHEILDMLLTGKTDKHQLPTAPLAGMTMDYIEHELASPRIFNNHLYPKHMPEGATDKVKVVCVSRNPKDIAVSMYHFNKVSPEMGYDGEWNDFLPLFLEGKGIYNSWWEYTLQWWNAEKKNPNILWLTYEDMQEDCLQQIKRVDQFLSTGRTLDFMETVNKRCSFQSMTKSLQAKHTRFFRKGEVGDWKNWFTVAQNEEFDTFHQQKMKNSNFTVRFEL